MTKHKLQNIQQKCEELHAQQDPNKVYCRCLKEASMKQQSYAS